MKKLVLTLGLACLFMVACNNTPKQEEVVAEPAPVEAPVVQEEHNCPMHALKEEYANWENLTDEAKAELNKKAADLFAEMEAKHQEMIANGEQAVEQVVEMTEEERAACEARCAEMKAAWENFANMTLDEQRDLILKRLEGCGGEHHCNHNDGEHHCNHNDGEHHCNHNDGEHHCNHENAPAETPVQ